MPQFVLITDRMRALFKGRGFSQGIITLEDGKTRCKSVVCREGVYAKDIIAEVCSELLIAPVAQPFFALCDRFSLHPVSPYRKMSIEDVKKQYQLRLFVNTGTNSAHFQKMNKSTYSYYYKQLKEDFIQDRLFPRATINTAVWMAAIDMAREALDKKKDFTDLSKNSKEMLRFMPRFLVEKYMKDQEMKRKLQITFDRFNKIQENITADHFVSKYIEVYEKDKMCGRHIYRLKQQAGRPRGQYLLVVSSKDGVYRTRGEDPIEEKEPTLCHIEDLCSLRVDLTALSVTIEFEKAPTTSRTTEVLLFTDRKELISFSVVVHTYHQILVDATSVILSGDLAPHEDCLRIGRDDGRRRDICHGPITPQEVTKVLQRIDRMKTGNYLIRESRNISNAYTLSLCANGQIYNYRIIQSTNGDYCFEGPKGQEPSDEHTKFTTLRALIEHYSQNQNGLPCKLGTNICPNIASIPLMPTMLSIHSDNSSSTASMIINGSNRLSEVSSPDHTPNSTTPSSPTSTSAHHTLTQSISHFPRVMSDTSSNYPDTSNTSSVPTTDTSGIPSISLTSNSGLSSRPGNLPLDSPSTSLSFTASSNPQSPNTSDSKFLERIAPRKPSIELNSNPSTSVGLPQTPLIRELIEVGVNYISFSELRITGDLGSGNYSQVHLADWTRGKDSSEVIKVAVKIPTAKPNTVDEVKKELKREIETMAALNHPNIVHLLGISEVQHFISYIGELPVVIMEFVEGGSLRGLLDRVKRSPGLASTMLFLSYGKQIADGMKYLEEKKLVHRDLAARNVLLIKETEQVKISDFGLARQGTSSKDYAYYIGQNSSNGLPIFWYAPECLRNLRFTTKGDVWSYGVTLWEMFSHGELPTQILGRVIKDNSVTSAQLAFRRLADHLEHPNNRLPKRMSCPKEVYDVMGQCWSSRPGDRPSFSELSKIMEGLYNLAKRKTQHRRDT